MDRRITLQSPPTAQEAIYGTATGDWTTFAANVQAEVRDFMPGLKPAQYLEVDYLGTKAVVLGVPIDGPNDFTSSDGKKINPWHYNVSNPINNPGSYDLWMDIVLRGKTNRICNWSESPLIVN